MEARIILVALFALFINSSSCDFSSHAIAKNTEREEPNTNSLCPSDEDPKNPTVLPYPNDCSKFYKCLHGKAYPISCPQGLHFSAKMKRCDWPEVAECDPSVPTTKTPEGSGPTSSPLPPTSAGPTTEPPKLHPLCPADDDPKNPTVLPDPDNCSRFFKCLNKVAYPISCPQGLHWSKKLQRCDWPEVAECDPKIPTTKAPEGTTSPTTALPPVSTTPSPDGPKKDPRCPEDDDLKNPTSLPYPSDCSKFYKCLRGMAYPVACPVGLHWSTTLNRCDWPEVAKCDPNVKVPADRQALKVPLKKEQLTTAKPKTTTIIPTSVTPPIHIDCPANEDPKNPTLLPNPDDCTKFFKCVNKRGYPIACPSGLHFSIKLGRCDWPEVAGCDPNIKTTALPSTTPAPKPFPSTTPAPSVPLDCPPNEDPENPTVLPYPGDCSKFYKCLSGKAYPIACPAGLHYSPKLERCDWPEIANCDPNIKVGPTAQPEVSTTTPASVSTTQAAQEKLILPGIPAKAVETCKGQHQLIAHEADCTKFIQCAGDLAVERSCPVGTHFNAQFMVCDYPERAGCQGGSLKSEQTKTIGAETPTAIGAPVQATAPRKETNQENICDGAADNAYLQHPQDCSRYVHCYNKQMFIQQCPPGLLWNHKSNYCDYKEKVDCNN